MKTSRYLFGAALCGSMFGATAASPQTFGSVHAGTYGETTYEEIAGIEMTTRRMFSNHTYDIVVPNTLTGDVIVCQLHDDTGHVFRQKLANSLSRETRFYFQSQVVAASARCFYARVERLTRPSGSP